MIIWDLIIIYFNIKVYKYCTVLENLLKGTYAEQGGMQNKAAGTGNTGMFLKSAALEPCEAAHWCSGPRICS